MKNLFIYMLCMLMFGCTLEIAAPDSVPPVAYEEEAYTVEEYGYCMYDPLPMDTTMDYCISYMNADCCFWSQSHSADWYCEYQWCFYWDSCEWEYIESECWW